MVNSVINSPNSGVETNEHTSNNNDIITCPPIPISNNNQARYDQMLQLDDINLGPLDYAPPMNYAQIYIQQSNRQMQKLQQQDRQYIPQHNQQHNQQQGIPISHEISTHSDYYQMYNNHNHNTNTNNNTNSTEDFNKSLEIRGSKSVFSDMSPFELEESQYSKPPSADFTYNKFDFDLTNHSLESIPDSISNSFDHSGSQTYINHAQTVFNNSPYNSNANDTFTSSFSDASSFTPNSTTEEYFRPAMGLTLKHLASLSAFPPVLKNVASFKANRKSLNEMNSSLDSKKNLMILTNLAMSTSSSSPSVESPSLVGISPICNKVNNLDSNRNLNLRIDPQTPNLKRMNQNFEGIFSSNSSQSLDDKRRKTCHLFNEFLISAFEKLTPNKSINSFSSSGSILEKPKKYTRRKLLPRSKSGCWICRIKHLKCDETRPVCKSCIKLGIECDYSPTRPDYISDKNLKKAKLESISNMRKLKQMNDKFKS